MSGQHACTWSQQRPEEAIRSLGTRVAGDCELPTSCWESTPGPLQEQPGLFTTEPPLKPLKSYYWILYVSVIQIGYSLLYKKLSVSCCLGPGFCLAFPVGQSFLFLFIKIFLVLPSRHCSGCFVFVFFRTGGINLRALRMLGKHSTTKLHPLKFPLMSGQHLQTPCLPCRPPPPDFFMFSQSLDCPLFCHICLLCHCLHSIRDSCTESPQNLHMTP